MKLFHSHYILVCLLLLSNESPAQTQDIKFSLFSGTNGITLGKINGMARDKYGYLWFSDQSNRSIIRFDGSHMTRYQNDPQNPNSLGGFYPECLFADSSGNIWIGFYGMGLDKFDPVANKFTHYRHSDKDPESLSNDFVTALLVDHLGNVWVGNYGGVDLLDENTGKFKHYSHRANDLSSLSCNSVRSLYEDKAGELWVGTGFAFDPATDDGGLNRFNRTAGTFTRYMHDPKNPHSLISNKVRAIFEDSYGNFWVGTNGDGLHTMDRKTGLFERHTYDPKHPDQLSRPALTADAYDHITFITEDAAKKLWIGTLDNGVARYDPETKKIIHYLNYNGGTKDASSWWANAGHDGLIWLSTQSANLYKIDIYNTTIPHFGNSDADAVLSFEEESPSVMWYGTASGLVRKDLAKGTTRRFLNEPGNKNSLSNNFVNSVLKDKQGGLWVGTGNGLNHFNPETEKFTRYYFDSINNTTIINTTIANTNIATPLCEDRDLNIWTGSWGNGLYKIDHKSGKFTNYRNSPADVTTISNNFPVVIVEDNSGDLWIGTAFNSGLNKLNRQTEKFTHYLPGMTIACICRDADGNIWVGTEGGLFRYDKKSDNYRSIGEETTGINIVQIESIAADKENNLWIATESGIYRLNKRRDQVTRYGKEYGIPDADNFFQYSSSFSRHDGQLNFGNFSGYFAFYPEALKTSDTKTKLYFTGLWLDNRKVSPDKEGALRESLYDAKEIRLKHDQDVFSLSATYVDYRNIGKTILYRLENYDQDWRRAAPEEKIQYFKVPPGKYVFRIKTANSSNGEWTEKSMDIIILPPWWTTWWAYCIYGIILCVLVILVHRYQKSRIVRAERERSHAKELIQAKEIEKAYHELQTTQSLLVQSEKMASLGELTAGIAHEIQNPLNFVNNFSDLNEELLTEMKDELRKGKIDDALALANSAIENQRKINHHGKRADAIVKGMLQHSRNSAGQKEPTDINALADEYLRLAYHGLKAKDRSFNATLKTDFDENIGKVNIIPQEIGRVILNLINNAFYAVSARASALVKTLPDKLATGDSRYEPTVWVSTKKMGDQILITVKDNGPGIPQKILDKIFQPFFTTKPTGQGTGLGLSLAYDIVKAHGGDIKVTTKESNGSEFTISLPA